MSGRITPRCQGPTSEVGRTRRTSDSGKWRRGPALCPVNLETAGIGPATANCASHSPHPRPVAAKNN